MKIRTITHQFVEFIPDVLEDGFIYVSIPYTTAVHKCCCGCGNQVVTPLSPTGWTLSFDGKSVALDPSIGNWSFPCRSHYWIESNRVTWARTWSKEEIDEVRDDERSERRRYFTDRDPSSVEAQPHPKKNVWRRLRKLFRG